MSERKYRRVAIQVELEVSDDVSLEQVRSGLEQFLKNKQILPSGTGGLALVADCLPAEYVDTSAGQLAEEFLRSCPTDVVVEEKPLAEPDRESPEYKEAPIARHEEPQGQAVKDPHL